MKKNNLSNISNDESIGRIAEAKKELQRNLHENRIDEKRFYEIVQNLNLSDAEQENLEGWAQKNNIEILMDEEEFQKMGMEGYIDSVWENRPKNSPLIDGFTKYLKDISQYPLLTQEEEKELARRVKNGDQEAFDTLVTSNLRLVVSLAKKIKYRGNLSFPEVVQEGNVGLIEAVPNFDPERTTSFASYARWHIHHVMYRAVENTGRTIRVPVSAQADMLKINRFRREYVLMNGCEPTDEEIIKAIPAINEKKIKNLRPHFARPSSIDIPTGDNESTNICDFIVDNKNSNVEKDIEQSFLKEDLAKVLRKSLDENEKRVLLKKFGIGCDRKSTTEIAEEMGIERAKVNELYSKAIAKLRTAKNMELLKVYLSNV